MLVLKGVLIHLSVDENGVWHADAVGELRDEKDEHGYQTKPKETKASTPENAVKYVLAQVLSDRKPVKR